MLSAPAIMQEVNTAYMCDHGYSSAFLSLLILHCAKCRLTELPAWAWLLVSTCFTMNLSFYHAVFKRYAVQAMHLEEYVLRHCAPRDVTGVWIAVMC